MGILGGFVYLVDFPINNEVYRVRQRGGVASTLQERPDMAVYPDPHQSEDTDVSENSTVTCQMPEDGGESRHNLVGGGRRH
jgi:transcription elongation GreA/GreB family factor